MTHAHARTIDKIDKQQQEKKPATHHRNVKGVLERPAFLHNTMEQETQVRKCNLGKGNGNTTGSGQDVGK